MGHVLWQYYAVYDGRERHYVSRYGVPDQSFISAGVTLCGRNWRAESFIKSPSYSVSKTPCLRCLMEKAVRERGGESS